MQRLSINRQPLKKMALSPLVEPRPEALTPLPPDSVPPTILLRLERPLRLPEPLRHRPLQYLQHRHPEQLRRQPILRSLRLVLRQIPRLRPVLPEETERELPTASDRP